MERSLFFVLVLVSVGLVVSQDDDPTTVAPTDPTTTEVTTTTTTSTTTAPPTTTTPAPTPGNYFYNVTSQDKKNVCIMLAGDIAFNIEFGITPNGTNKTTVNLPTPSSAVRVHGNCSETNHFISISWGPSAAAHQITIFFGLSDTKKTWNVTHLSAIIPIDDQFKNASDAGKNIEINATLAMQPHYVPVNQSFKCIEMNGGNYTANLDTAEQEYTHPITMEFSDIQVEAFNKNGDDKHFAAEIHCDADKTSDIVPIAVGCALGGLVVVVLIAYVVGRRRRSAAYQSV